MRQFHVYFEEPGGGISTVAAEHEWVIGAMLKASECTPINGWKGPRSTLEMWADEVK